MNCEPAVPPPRVVQRPMLDPGWRKIINKQAPSSDNPSKSFIVFQATLVARRSPPHGAGIYAFVHVSLSSAGQTFVYCLCAAKAKQLLRFQLAMQPGLASRCCSRTDNIATACS